MKLAQYKLSKRIKFRGLDVSIEQDEGEIRHWTDAESGTKGKTKMHVPYGYIRRTEGMDGDHVDVFIGPYENARDVFVVHQMKLPDFKEFDEDKCMLGFSTAEEAKATYLNHFNDDRFFGSMTTMPFEEFKTKVLGTFKDPKKIASALQYGQESTMSLSQALRSFAKTGSAPTVQDSAQEASDIARHLRGFARRHGSTIGMESASNLASKALDDLPTKAAMLAIRDFELEKQATSKNVRQQLSGLARAGEERIDDLGTLKNWTRQPGWNDANTAAVTRNNAFPEPSAAQRYGMNKMDKVTAGRTHARGIGVAAREAAEAAQKVTKLKNVARSIAKAAALINKQAGFFDNWLRGGQGTSTVAQNYHPDTVTRAHDTEQGRSPSVPRPQLPPQILNAQGAPQQQPKPLGAQPSAGPARNQWAFDAGSAR